MDALQPQDVPYGNDWDSMAEAAAYGEAADRARPWRSQLREEIAHQIAALGPGCRVLELGSGPGLLAHTVLEQCPSISAYTLLDFSEPMLALSRTRLAAFPAASFVRASFKATDWPERVSGPFDCVVSMQAVHELRHKRHAAGLYEHVYQLLARPGLFMVCDHTPFDESARSQALYMSSAEQQQALTLAGFARVRVLADSRGLLLYAGDKAA
jgi:cyclopropane fatty-acyl-phospholipid synthase-like methyltransferase